MTEVKNFKGSSVIVVFGVIFLLLFLLAKREGKNKAQGVQVDCLRDSYDMAEKTGGTPKEHETECLRQYEEDQLRALDRG